MPNIAHKNENGHRNLWSTPKPLLSRPDGYIDAAEAEASYSLPRGLLSREYRKGRAERIMYWKKNPNGFHKISAYKPEQVEEIAKQYYAEDWSLPIGAIREIDAADSLCLKPSSLYALCRSRKIKRYTKIVSRKNKKRIHYYLYEDIKTLQEEKH